MKILIITPHFYPEIFKVNDLVEHLRKNHKITVLTSIPHYPKGVYHSGYGIFKNRRVFDPLNNLCIIRTFVIPRRKGRPIDLIINYISYIVSSVFNIAKILKYNYNQIFVFETSPITVGLPAVFYKYIKKTPLHFWVLDLWPESIKAATSINSNIFDKFLNPIVKLIYDKSDIIYISSKGFKKSIVEKGDYGKKIKYLPNWVEPELNVQLVENKVLSLKLCIPEGFIIMFTGNMGEAQDFKSIFNAMLRLKEYRDIHWFFIGDGKKKQWLYKQVLDNEILSNVHFKGIQSLESIPYYFQVADVLIASLKKKTIFALTVPQKIQSYLSSGKPISTMLDGEGSAIVNDAGAGMTTGAGDYIGFADNLLKLYKMNRTERRLLGKNGYNYHKKYFNRNDLLLEIENNMKRSM